MIYLDHLAATPLLPCVKSAMEPYLSEKFGNPTHLHRMGLEAAEALRRARTEAAGLLGAAPDEITFVSSGTEAANAVLKGLAWKHPGGHLVLSAAEHPALHDTAGFLERMGHPVTRVPVDGQGFVDPEAVRQAIRPGTFLVATHLSNHDSGAVQDLRAIGHAARAAGVPVFCDATTGGGWIGLDVAGFPVDFASLSPHRFGGPKGTGILYHRRGYDWEPLIHGGRQEAGHRGGTEAVAGIVGAGAACGEATRSPEERASKVAALRDRLWFELQQAVPDVVLNGPPPGAMRDPRHLNVAFPGVEGEALMLLLDLRGVAVTAASGCLGPGEKYSRVLQAMGVPQTHIRAAVLMAPAPHQEPEEMSRAAAIIARAVGKIRSV